MKRVLFILICFLNISSLFAQEDSFYRAVDRHVGKSIKYPPSAKEGDFAIVFLEFDNAKKKISIRNAVKDEYVKSIEEIILQIEKLALKFKINQDFLLPIYLMRMSKKIDDGIMIQASNIAEISSVLTEMNKGKKIFRPIQIQSYPSNWRIE